MRRRFNAAKPPPHELNLLNYRAELRQEKRRQLRRWLGLAGLVLLPALLLGGYRLSLQRQMAGWEAELMAMQTQLMPYAARPEEQQAAEQLARRGHTAMELQQISARHYPLLAWTSNLTIPDLYINGAELKGTDFSLHGHTATYAALAELAAQMEAAPWLAEVREADCAWNEARQRYTFTLRAGREATLP